MRRTGLMIAFLAIAAAEPPRERVIMGEGIIGAIVAGRSVRLRVDPAAPAMPLIDRDLAERAHLKMTGSWGVGIGYRIGTGGVMARTQVVRINLGGGTTKRRVGWTDRPFARVADGSVGPEALSEPIVRFALHAPQPGERTAVFPAVRDSAALGLFGNFSTTFAVIAVGGEPMRIRFDPYHRRTLATAGAAVRLARLHDGEVSGDTVPTEIFFGIERPVRTLTLRTPLALGAVRIATLGVRTTDDGNAASFREAGATVPAADPDEIVVTAKGRKRDIRRDTISLGADYLSRCSSIVFDRSAKVIRLTCA